ncbi:MULTISPECIES: hypothetical protein [unclassified Pantoea]|uniref:hypothetical protein n=1 Tax=unclassified Pantoea TaxID=2630326 RepID=UPI00247751D9|nr:MULTISPECIES: hypothetical protein [unclassified Pantoea]GME37979.1 hypothetical protein ACJ1_19780 [Pantoea sp. QMID1]GME38098.1 hypothetical protein ACJ3_20270 [Pantoea sp. QMID3]GME53183.1 hypothetical protein ACJ4_12260 [Pantoea sp. QMID4]GME54171.1 hypothetical protein ACJ2_11890 [Pantoea sp. QMID2]
MKNLFKWFALIAITMLVCGGLFFWFVALVSDEATVYKDNDFFNYHMLTDPDIEKAPRITYEFYFESHPGDGYSPSNSIVFKGASDTASLRTYLEKLGYEKQRRSLGEKERWAKPDQLDGDLFYLYFDPTTHEIELTKVLNN